VGQVFLNRKRSEWGYTLLELLLVLAILSGAGFMLLLKVSAIYDAQRLEHAATLVMEDLREAKQAAVTENVFYQVAFYANNTYCVKRQDQVVKWVSLPEGVHFAHIPKPDIIFYAQGTPNMGNRVLLEYRGKLKSVIVSAVGGRIRVE